MIGTIAALAGSMFVSMLGCLEVGLRVGRRHRGEAQGLSAIDGAIFGLMGLLVAFTFSGAYSRFDYRRNLIVEEANDVGTAYLRLDLLESADRDRLRKVFADYLEARLAVTRAIPDVPAVNAALERAKALQKQIWDDALPAARKASPQATMLLLPALNAMFDITSTRLAAFWMHPPGIIFTLLILVFLMCSLLAGYSMAARPERSWLHILIFVTVLTATLCTIVDLEYPRYGFIRVDSFDRLLEDQLRGMR